jgi:hypothetical protein
MVSHCDANDILSVLSSGHLHSYIFFHELFAQIFFPFFTTGPFVFLLLICKCSSHTPIQVLWQTQALWIFSCSGT